MRWRLFLLPRSCGRGELPAVHSVLGIIFVDEWLTVRQDLNNFVTVTVDKPHSHG